MRADNGGADFNAGAAAAAASPETPPPPPSNIKEQMVPMQRGVHVIACESPKAEIESRACKSGRGFYLKMRALPFTPRKGWLLLILRKTKLYCALASRLLIFFLSLSRSGRVHLQSEQEEDKVLRNF